MSESIAYRGPDNNGFIVRESSSEMNPSISVGLGHQRLSIIDLTEAGQQPMTNEEGVIWLTFNGEIYNYRELRDKLIQKGHDFISHSDTEVVIHLYEEYGVEAVHRLNGMFAFALWDQRNECLWLCRDRIGVKPLVYHWDGRRLTLASEIKALLVNPEIGREMDVEALRLYLAYGYVPAPYTIFRRIRKLPPGHMMTLEQGYPKIIPYWDLERGDRDPRQFWHDPGSCEYYQKRLFDTLSDAVQSQMAADVPLGAFLSGGIDSSIIVALMAKHSDRPIKTFSIGFEADPRYDETGYARDVARMYRTDHHEIKLSYRDLLDVFPVVLDTFDEPFADSSAIPTFIVSRETRKHVTVALSGDGGDELFAGYRSYLAEYWRRRYNLIPALLRKGILEKAVALMPDSRDAAWGEYARRAKKFIRGTQGPFHERVVGLKEIFPQMVRKKMLLPSLGFDSGNGRDPALDWAAGFLDRFSGDSINRILYFDLKDSLPGDMLTKVDWMSMRNSLEVRVPFLDHRVVELAFEIPGELKLRGGITKHFLKETFKPLLPKSLHRRPKAGFEIPIGRWLREELRPLVDTYLAEERVRDQGIFDYPVIAKLIDSHMRRKTDTSWMLWSLVVFQYWHDTYMK